ncbi:MAG: cation diffusion facilitator family transporter [Pirellulaceae bacterium]
MHVHENCLHATDFGRAFAIGIIINLAFVLIEAVCGWWFNSVSLLADAGHNLSDVFGLILAWVGFRLSRIPPSDRFTYGLGSSTILAATINGAILLVAVGAIIWEAVGRFRSPVEVQTGGVMIVAAIGVVINTATALLFHRGRHHDLNIRGAWLHMMADAAISLGVIIAALMIQWTSWHWIDPLVSLLIAGMIFISTWGLLRASMRLLSQGVPEGIDVNQIRDCLLEMPGVTAVHDLHVWALSTTITAMTAHLVKPDVANDDELLSRIADEMLHRFSIEHCTVQIERNALNARCSLIADDTP